MRILLVILLLVLGCTHTDPANTTLPDPIGHAIDVNAKPWSTKLTPDVKIVQVSLPTGESFNQRVTTTNASAFVMPRRDASDPQIEYVYFTVSGATYRIEGLPLPHRPISELAWSTPRYLTFDRWSQPHYGMHYVIDIERLSLVHSTPFPDQFYLDQQREESEAAAARYGGQSEAKPTMDRR